jgi:hypothetical protein
MVTLPGRRVAEVQVISSFGEDEFNELSFVTVVSGEISRPLGDYYLSDQ